MCMYQLLKRYLFSGSISAFVCFYNMAERELNYVSIGDWLFRFVT